MHTYTVPTFEDDEAAEMEGPAAALPPVGLKKLPKTVEKETKMNNTSL